MDDQDETKTDDASFKKEKEKVKSTSSPSSNGVVAKKKAIPSDDQNEFTLHDHPQRQTNNKHNELAVFHSREKRRSNPDTVLVCDSNSARMQARRLFSTVAKKTDWEKLLSKASSPAAKSEIARLQQVYGKIEQDAASLSTTVPPIDFAAYRTRLSGADLVNDMEKAYSALEYPMGTNTMAAKAETKLNELLGAAKATSTQSAERAKELESYLAKLHSGSTTGIWILSVNFHQPNS